jgi:predicted nucleic acid-binding protein
MEPLRRIYWDTMLFVYLFDNHPKYANRVAEIYARMQERTDILCASVLVFAEVLAGPTITKDIDAQASITAFFHSPEVSILPFAMEAAPVFARLRAAGVRSADAMHIAAAATAKVDLFITNDKRLTKLSLPGLPFIASLETDLF